MPIYSYENPNTGDIIEIVQSMHDEHEYTDDNGVSWNRIFSIPNTTIDSDIDPFSTRSFLDKTNSRGSVGDLMERSKELSDKRKNKLGYDPVQKKYFENYSKKRNGRKHNLDK